MAPYDLDTIASTLVSAGFAADVRGRTSAPFVFATHDGRAVELSASDIGIWVEFWDRDDESPKFDSTIPAQADAIAAAQAWLTGEALATVKAPPPLLDGARVLWWAWSGDTPFGELSGTEKDDRWVHGFAVCQYDSGEIYRFTCNRRWEVVQDMDHATEDDAKASIPVNYDASRVRWQRSAT